jgi:hypothetical protein
VSNLIDEINALEAGWHGRGSVSAPVIAALERHARGCGEIARSMETGTGRTTLLLSHLSQDHLVFTIDDTGDGNSLARVRESPLLNTATTRFVVGPSQRTLLSHDFQGPLDLAYLDGPHAYPFPELEYWAVYPHLRPGALLVVDDVQIPSIANMHDVLCADAMYEPLGVVDNCAFLRRTSAPALDPFGEGWWEQAYNDRVSTSHLTLLERAVRRAKLATPEPLRELLKGRIRRAR